MSTPMATANPPLRVALVEDDRIEAERAIAALRAAGHEVEWFTEGVQFMSEVREARHELFLFDASTTMSASSRPWRLGPTTTSSSRPRRACCWPASPP